ncbi:hypothetical protein GCM10027161_18100 [Microbispora hainanensis]
MSPPEDRRRGQARSGFQSMGKIRVPADGLPLPRTVQATCGNVFKIIARIFVDRRQTGAQSGLRLHGPEKQKRPRRASDLLFCWWQVQGSNLGRLSRRFYSA